MAINLDRGYRDYLEKRDEIIRTYKEQGRRSEIQDALKRLLAGMSLEQVYLKICATYQENILRTTFTMLKSARLLPRQKQQRKWLRLFWKMRMAERSTSIQFIIILIQMK